MRVMSRCVRCGVVTTRVAGCGSELGILTRQEKKKTFFENNELGVKYEKRELHGWWGDGSGGRNRTGADVFGQHAVEKNVCQHGH